MKRKGYIYVVGFLVLLAHLCAAESDYLPRRSVESSKRVESESKVTSVYGVSADDYLPSMETIKKTMSPVVDCNTSQSSIDFPDTFYFIAAPIFLFVFLFVLSIFLDDFEKMRGEEQRKDKGSSHPREAPL